MGNFCNKSTETTLHEMCVHVFLRFSDSNKPSQSVSLIYELAWLAGIGKSEEYLLKTSSKVAPLIKVAHKFWWRQNNRKQSASARERCCNVSCDIPYWLNFGPISLFFHFILSTNPVSVNIILMSKAWSIWYSGGGGWLGIFFRGKKFSFGQFWSKIIFFAGPSGRIIYFYNQKL